MSDANNVWDNLNTAVVISDADFNVTYANKRAFDLFDELSIVGLEVGGNMHNCHQPETMVKLKALYQAFADKKLTINHMVQESPIGTITIVNAPFFEGDKFAGVVEMVFEKSLA